MDGVLDIFEYCGKSITINSSPKVRKSAIYSVDTDDLTDILSTYFVGNPK
jgi:phosphoserine phosphatase